MQAQRKLAAAQAQFVNVTAGQNEKAKKVLMSMMAGSTHAVMAASFNGWSTFTKQMRVEASIRSEYEDQIRTTKQKLLDYKAANLKGVTSAVEKDAESRNALLVTSCFSTWKETAEDRKLDENGKAQLAALEAKFAEAKGTQQDNTRNVMMRMNADKDAMLIGVCFQGFVTFHLDYAKNKEMEDRVKKAEQQVQTFMNSKKAGAKKILDGVNSGTNLGILKTTMSAWRQLWDDGKKEAELAEQLNNAQSKLSGFQDRSKNSAHSVTERARMHYEAMICLKVIYFWMRDSRVEAALRRYHYQIDGKRHQLLGVQKMFRDFAQQLEAGLNFDSAREQRSGYVKQRRLMRDNEGSVSLPAINTGRSGRSAGHSGR